MKTIQYKLLYLTFAQSRYEYLVALIKALVKNEHRAFISMETVLLNTNFPYIFKNNLITFCIIPIVKYTKLDV